MYTRWAWFGFAVAAGLATGCGAGLYDQYAPLTILDNFHPIEDGRAYRSAQLDGASLALVLEEYGIRTVVNLRGENVGEPWYDTERAVVTAAGAKLVDIGMSANALPSREALLLLYDTFETAEEPVLIHCKAGADRTSAAAAIWRMAVDGDSRAAAMRELSPLYGYFAALKPAMIELVRMFQPDREWILSAYPGSDSQPED